ncbi:UNVERIFIED_CONTAM: hypothetical protein FKN15_051570 [Acipenser sinensis]
MNSYATLMKKIECEDTIIIKSFDVSRKLHLPAMVTTELTETPELLTQSLKLRKLGR